MLPPIVLSEHVLRQADARGVTIDEITGAIRAGRWIRIGAGRFECRHNAPCAQSWGGTRGDTKQVRPIFAVEPSRIVVISVYGYRVRTRGR